MNNKRLTFQEIEQKLFSVLDFVKNSVFFVIKLLITGPGFILPNFLLLNPLIFFIRWHGSKKKNGKLLTYYLPKNLFKESLDNINSTTILVFSFALWEVFTLTNSANKSMLDPLETISAVAILGILSLILNEILKKIYSFLDS